MNICIFGATSAIAHACARRWAGPGTRFALVGRDSVRTEAIAADLTARGAASARVWTHDFASAASVAALVADIEAAIGPLDRVLIAQGTMPPQDASAGNPDSVAQLYAVNTASVVAAMLAAALWMRPRGRGDVIVLGSVAGDRGRPSNYLYGSTKAAIATACAGLQLELAGSGVRVLLVKPGMVRSPMTAGMPDSPLFAEADTVAASIDAGLRGRAGTIYAPAWWRVIMLVIRHAPSVVVRRL
jgi:short-subunit dehydrogenase